jgi:glutamate--cysteine ligase
LIRMTNLAVAPLRVSDGDAPIRCPDELMEIFQEAEKPPERWRIGAESERFGVDAVTGAPLDYAGERSVLQIFGELRRRFGWAPRREAPGGPIIGLRRGEASISLEPGAQVELSGLPLPDVHAVKVEMQNHLQELAVASEGLGLRWLAVGFHPTARLADLPRVPKQRYAIMREYMPSRGSGGLDMMWRTATVQANFDFGGEADALRKLRVSLRLAPLVNAMTANSPFAEGRRTGMKSLRGDVWMRVDQERSGIIPSLWEARRPRYCDYMEWALDAGMYLFLRGDRVIANTGQSFRSFLFHGYRGFRATRADWKLHLNTLFPEVRLRNTLEVRSADALPTVLAAAVPALYAGVLYDDRALDEAEQMMAPFDYASVAGARPGLVRNGLRARVGDLPAQQLAEQLLEIAAGGLRRRARLNAAGADESVHLDPLVRLVQAGTCPADLLTAGLPPGVDVPLAELVARTAA